MDKGWVKIHRSIMDSGVYSDNTRFKAWVDLILRANHEDKEWFDHGHLVQIRKGQVITSTRKLAEAWNCNRETVDTILKQFVKMGMIERYSQPGKYTLITIVKYGFYQGKGNHHPATDPDTDQATDPDIEPYTDQATEQDTDPDIAPAQTRITRTINNDIKNDQEPKNPASRFGSFDSELED